MLWAPKEFQPRRARYNLEEAEMQVGEAEELRTKLQEDLCQLKCSPQSFRNGDLTMPSTSVS